MALAFQNNQIHLKLLAFNLAKVELLLKLFYISNFTVYYVCPSSTLFPQYPKNHIKNALYFLIIISFKSVVVVVVVFFGIGIG